MLEQLDEQIDVYDARIKQLAEKHPDVEVIAQPKGVGTLTALVFLLMLEDNALFSNSRTVGAFIGFNPASFSNLSFRPDSYWWSFSSSSRRRLTISLRDEIELCELVVCQLMQIGILRDHSIDVCVGQLIEFFRIDKLLSLRSWSRLYLRMLPLMAES